MSLKSYFISRKWWFLAGTIFFIIYIAVFVYLITYPDRPGFPWEIRFLIILFFGGFFGELLTKSKNGLFIFSSSIIISIYQGILFYLIYWVGFQNIINQILTGPWGGDGPITYPIESTVGLTIFFFPLNLFGGILGLVIVYLLGRFIKKSPKD